ncbi:mitogen-activated protein kinase kinase kinase 18-like [Benincasa hispida]|uniref:mitogen-activated protein kinase kinase kinase 18-like n=1 Tax=Benincasa hispida TaxID=102211 RepID=UPI0019012762|nr:mitogen-activated protein kinase kinase kinase 18-like [Benincasa hispida]
MVKTTPLSWTRTKSVIGKGSFGTVSVGIGKSDGRIFAVKSVEQSIGFRRQIESLENEIRILRSLNSPYVVGFLGDDVSNESPTTSFRNLHMEYLPGGTVADDATAAGDDKLLRERTRCLVSALSYIHSKGIVHCDVKGRNILIGLNPRVVKLADFGSAIELSRAGDRCLGSIAPRGSPLWMAPEVVRGEFQGPESDVWSVGCTVIEMVTGKPAWEDFGADTLSRIGFSDDLPDFPTRLSDVGRDFLRKCLRRNPSERWSCDRLLQHPFLAAAASPEIAVENSPRCVLDWVNGSFSDDEEEIPIANETSGFGGQESELSGKERIGKLSTSVWPNWESDGWSPVRSCCSEAAAETEAICREEEEDDEGAEWEYGNLRGVEGEMEGTSSEYLEFVADNHGKLGAEYSNHGGMKIPERPRNNYGGSDGDGGGSGGLSFRRWGSERDEITTITSWKYSIEWILCYYYYWKILMKQLVLFGNYTLLPLCLKTLP